MGSAQYQIGWPVEGNSNQLDRCRASFEASPSPEETPRAASRRGAAPQDEEFSQYVQQYTLMLRSDPAWSGRVSKHALRLVQRILAQPRKAARCDVEEALSLAYSITLSARSRKAGGIVKPSASAVLRLTTSSNFAGC